MIAGGNHTIMYAILLVAPVAVPDKIIASRWMLDFIDRCHSLASLTPPQAALGSLPPLGRILLATFLAGTRKVALRRMQCYEFAAENAYHTVLLHGRPQGSPLRGLKRILCFKLQLWLSALISRPQNIVIER